MTSEEVRKQVSPMVVWMADGAIRQARKGIAGKTFSKSIEAEYSRPEVDAAADVLFRMFNVCTAEIKGALMSMPDQLDGVRSIKGMNYLDCFVEQLARMHSPEALELREVDWVLNLC